MSLTENDVADVAVYGDWLERCCEIEGRCAGIAGLVYPESSPFGFNGGYYYMRATWDMP